MGGPERSRSAWRSRALRRRRRRAEMHEFVRHRHETVVVVAGRSEAVDATALSADGKARPGGHDVVRRELMAVGNRQPDDILPRPERQPREAALDDAAA